VMVAAVLLWRRTPRTAIAAAAVLAVLWGGLVLTFSQSSFVSLLAGLAVLAALRWDARRAAAVTAVGGAIAIASLLVFQDTLRIELGSSSGLNRATSGRIDLIEGGLDLFADRPLWGYGSGSFARAFRLERKGNQQQAVSASHTMPITIAAEQGLVGLAVYALVLFAGYALLLGVDLPAPGSRQEGHTGGRAPRAPPGDPALDGVRAPGPLSGEPAAEWAYAAARAALVAAFTVLVVHTMMYAAFLEDPVAWLLLGVGAALAPMAWPARKARPAGIAATEPAAAQA
jgi:O-antigen ligase